MSKQKKPEQEKEMEVIDNKVVEEKAVDKSTVKDKKSESSSSKSAPSKSSGNKFSLIISVIILLIVAGASYYFYEQLKNQDKQFDKQNRLISSLKTSQENISAKTRSSESQISSQQVQLTELNNKLVETQNISQQAMQIITRNQRDWIMAEVDYLLRMANQRLNIARDINGAIAALKGADNRLADLGDLNLIKIRKQLAKDIAILSSIHQVDINGISLKLDEMMAYVSELPFKSAQSEIKAQLESEKKESSTVDGQKNFIDAVVDTVKEIGDIKIHKRDIKTASSSEQQTQIEQKLKVHLLSARLAVLRYDQQQLSMEIKQSKSLLESYYDAEDNRIGQLLKDLSGFATVKLKPELPEITEAWNLLQKEIIRQKSELKESKVIELQEAE